MDDLAEGWTSHKAPTGHTYYYNRTTKQSTYKRPVKPISPAPPPAETATASKVSDAGENLVQDSSSTNLNLRAGEITDVVAQVHERAAKTPDGDYPKYRFAISTAEPWLLIETKKGREFYHNPQTNESHWQVPDWLLSPLQEWRKSLEEQESDGSSEMREDNPESEESDAFEAEAAMPADTEYNEDDIAWQLAAMEEEGHGQFNGSQDDGPEFTLMEKIDIFKKMLLDLEIDPFSTWDAELPRMAADPRYLILENTHQRKSAFEDYCTEQGLKLQEEKAEIVKEDVSLTVISSGFY